MIVLTRFAQEADMSDPNKIEYFLVFSRDGKEMRLPVPKETVDVLISEVYGGEKGSKPSEGQPEHPPEATQFGGNGDDADEEVEEEFTEQEEQEEWEEPQDRVPENEDEVPSL